MPPTLVLIRHAQALHNADRVNGATFRDPGLSQLGRQQSVQLREHLKSHLLGDKKADLIVVSPMRRTLETCLIALDSLVADGVRVEPDARWQELWEKPCDTGSPASELSIEFPQIDFSGLGPAYPDKTSPAGAQYRYGKAEVFARAQSALKDLYNRPEKLIVVVSHSGFLRVVTSGTQFANSDYRLFDFVTDEPRNDSDDDRYELVESELTRGAGGMGLSRGEIKNVYWGVA
ncbi:histidine phosphatase superfamily [Podospora didyma]|uniref:Histidine phosphatase superfamily n=1 Tax=Podospora didyma TaxID=330526 RepID=A0AAE0NQM2_9PEZI|nr:histidine phosphatase superfamily [Podospora didyma]